MSPISEPPATTDVDTVVVGAGQAGLAVGQQLRSRGLDFVLLDASDEPGSSWRSRWDSLRLFTPATFSRLPGMPWEDPAASTPTKDAMADYLQAYAQRFALPIQHGTRIGAVRHGTRGSELEVEAEDGRCWTARNVVLATGAHARARVPDLAQCLGDQVEQVQSLRYQRPSQLSDGRVVVVGAGNSGAEIALDIVAGAAGPATSSTQMREVVLAGPDLGHLPRLGSWTYPLMQGLGRAGVALADRGSRGAGDPLGRVRPGELEAAGVRRVPRVVGARDDRLHLEDGSSLTAATVVWCTGLVPDHRLVRLPAALDPEGRVLHRRGVTPVAGLYVIGMPRQTSLTSHLVGGVGHDAELIVDHLRRR